MTGTIEDIWGHVYSGGGTYDVHVARPLTIESGQLPTTPYEVGDAFAPALHVYPPVPAAVGIRLLHMPDSDPAQAILYETGGQANRFGYFQPSAGTAITLTAPGEFRVDIEASYVAPDGALWMGSHLGQRGRAAGHTARRARSPGVGPGRPPQQSVVLSPPDVQWSGAALHVSLFHRRHPVGESD